jgi:hypothetical protein
MLSEKRAKRPITWLSSTDTKRLNGYLANISIVSPANNRTLEVRDAIPRLLLAIVVVRSGEGAARRKLPILTLHL